MNDQEVDVPFDYEKMKDDSEAVPEQIIDIDIGYEEITNAKESLDCGGWICVVYFGFRAVVFLWLLLTFFSGILPSSVWSVLIASVLRGSCHLYKGLFNQALDCMTYG